MLLWCDDDDGDDDGGDGDDCDDDDGDGDLSMILDENIAKCPKTFKSILHLLLWFTEVLDALKPIYKQAADKLQMVAWTALSNVSCKLLSSVNHQRLKLKRQLRKQGIEKAGWLLWNLELPLPLASIRAR